MRHLNSNKNNMTMTLWYFVRNSFVQVICYVLNYITVQNITQYNEKYYVLFILKILEEMTQL